MASFGIDEVGQLDDRVELVLGDSETIKFESYSVETSVLRQPCAFSTVLSAARSKISDLAQKYPPFTPFKLLIGGVQQFEGMTEGFRVHSSGSGPSSFELFGRDLMARLVDNDVDAEAQYTNLTYGDICRKALDESGLGDVQIVASSLEALRIRTGLGVKITANPNLGKKLNAYPAGGGTNQVIHAKLGESWHDFVERHVSRAGAFFFQGQDRTFILSYPGRITDPIFHFVRQLGTTSNICNITEASWSNDTTRRLTEASIYSRVGRKRYAKTKTLGGFVDEEMAFYETQSGVFKKKVYRDTNVQNAEQAEFYARKMIGERNRASWRLVYTLAGHTALGVQQQRAVVVPDVFATVDDDEFNIHGPMYIETVRYTSSPRRTEVTMMRPFDLVFGDESLLNAGADAPAPTPKPQTKQQDEVDELDALGLRIGTYGFIPRGGKTDTAIKNSGNK